jgi:hypothetical protein
MELVRSALQAAASDPEAARRFGSAASRRARCTIQCLMLAASVSIAIGMVRWRDAHMLVTTSMMRKEFMTGTMDCDSAAMICGPPVGDEEGTEAGGRSDRFEARHPSSEADSSEREREREI